MTVRELIKQLEESDPESIVVLSKDAEGNRFSPLYKLTPERYVSENSYSGWIEYEDADSGPDDVHAVVLWPIN